MNGGVWISLLAVVALPAAVPSAAAEPPTARQVLRRSLDKILGAKSYQAVLRVKRVKSGQTEQDSHRTLDFILVAGKKSATTRRETGDLTVDNGVRRWSYIRRFNAYSASRGGYTSDWLDLFPLRIRGAIEEPEMLQSTAVSGIRVSVIRVNRKPIPSQRGLLGGMTLYYINPRNSDLLQVHWEGWAKGGGTRSGSYMAETILISDARYNRPVPAGAFEFTPPKGATNLNAGPPRAR